MKGSRLNILLILSFLLMSFVVSKKPVEDTTIDKPTTPTTEQGETTEPETPVDEGIEVLTDADFRIAYFDYDKYNLRGDAREALEHNARVMRENTSVRVLIEGHCDERGTVEYNIALGEKRANSARDYLTSLGIEGSRIETISYGKERPVKLGHDETSWQENRRAKFTIVSQ